MVGTQLQTQVTASSQSNLWPRLCGDCEQPQCSPCAAACCSCVLHEHLRARARGGETWELAHRSLLLARVKQTDGPGSQRLGNFPSFSPREIKGCEEKSGLTLTEICLLSAVPSVREGSRARIFLLVIFLAVKGARYLSREFIAWKS